MKNKVVIIAIFAIIGSAIVWSISRGDKPPNMNTPVSQQKDKEITDNKMEEWKIYQNKEIGISFQYPNIFKRVNMQVVNGDTGRIFTGVFEFFPNHWISFGGATTDYSKAQGGSILSTQGYEKQGDGYVIKFVWGDNQVVPSEFWPVDDGKEQAIVIRNTEIGQILSREGVAVFVNIPNSLFPGMVFEIHPLRPSEPVDEKEIEILRQIISSITFDQ